jgi:hypothetical protein
MYYNKTATAPNKNWSFTMNTIISHTDVSSINSTDNIAEANSAQNAKDLNNMFDPQRLRLSQNFAGSVGVKKRTTVVQVRKPGKQEFIRVHPSRDYCVETAILEFKEEGETYLVDPSIWNDLPGELIPKIIYTTINRQGVVRLWPIRLPDEEGKLDDWNQSALESADIAKTAWIRVSSNRSAGMYETFEASGNLSEPQWPDLTFTEILKIAFKDKYIDRWDHPALIKLRGES